MARITKKQKKLMAAIVTITVAAVFLFGGNSLFSTTQTDFSMSGTFQPVKTTNVAFDVFDSDYELLGTITIDETSPRKFTDTNRIYPDVGVFRSNAPYNSDAAGSYVGTQILTTTEKRVFGDEVVFKHEAFMTYDVGARTYTALPALADTTTSVTPCAGMSVAHWSGGPVTITTNPSDYGYVPPGTMIARVDMGVAPWKFYATGNARVTQSLERIDFDGELAGSPASGLSFNDAITRLSTRYGNSAVIVRPRVTLTGVNNFERYTWEQDATLSNGTAVTMTMITRSAMVGFENAYVSKTAWSGLIPKVYEDQFDRAGIDYLDTGDADAKSPALNDASVNVEAMTASMKYVGDVSLPEGNVITRKITPIDYWTSIDSYTPTIDYNQILDGINPLPEEIVVSADFHLQPQTTVKIAKIDLTGTVMSYYFFDPVTYQHYSKSIIYPYALTIDNVASMQSFTMKIDLFTANEVQMVTSSGLPVDINDLVDFDLGSIIQNPGADDMVFEVESVAWWDNLFGMFSGMFGQVIQIAAIVMVIVIAIGIIYVVAQFKRK